MANIPQAPTIPSHTGYDYVLENVGRAVTALSSGKSHRERIIEACAEAHRPNDNEFFTVCMSDYTLQLWRDCSPGRFPGHHSMLTDEQLVELEQSLGAYIRHAYIDGGVRLAGVDPKEIDPFGADEYDDRTPPTRNPI